MRTLPGQLIRPLIANGTMRVGTMRMMPSGSSCRRPRVKTKLLRMSSLQSRKRSPMPTSRAAVIGQCFSMMAESGPPSTTNPSRRMVWTLPPRRGSCSYSCQSMVGSCARAASSTRAAPSPAMPPPTTTMRNVLAHPCVCGSSGCRRARSTGRCAR